MAMSGYQDKVLRINLTERSFKTEALRMDWVKDYIGSKGLACKYLYEELKPDVNPLYPDNKLILMNGPMTGTPVPCSGKLSVSAKSPQTGTIAESSIGGHVALNIKYAGYDAIIFEGALNQPGYILIEDSSIKFKDAGDLWGKGSHETETILAEMYGHDYSILSIGPAGENLLIAACINTDYYRHAGRGGIGAVMGSKNLKAIVVKGTGGVRISDIINATKRITEILREEVLKEENSLKKSGDEIFLEKRVGKKGCGSCGLGYENFIKIAKPTCEIEMHEMNSDAGSNTESANSEVKVKFRKLADDMGIDAVSAGNIINCAIEITEKGAHDFGIRSGEKEKYLKYLELIARREGVGQELAIGEKLLSEKYGIKNVAEHFKAVERSKAKSNNLSDEYRTSYAGENVGQVELNRAEYDAVKFSLCICDFWKSISFERMAELMTIITGTEWSVEDMKDAGRRVIEIAEAFNRRESKI